MKNKYMKKILLLILLLVFAAPVFSQADEKQAVLDAVDKLWAGMKAKSAEQIKAAFMPDGQLVAVDKPKDGKGLSTTRMLTGGEFAKLISEAKAPDFVESMIDPQVYVTGDMALVTGRYTFYVGDKFSHCGVDTFNLVRTETGWKIANGASTLEFACDADIKAVKVPSITADPKDVSTIDGIVKAFYEVITGPKGAPRQWPRDRSLYIPNVRFVSMGEDKGKIRARISSHQQFVDGSNESLVKDGFTEREINRVTEKYGNIAHVFSTYEFTSDDGKDKGRGINSIELFWDGTRWWISAASWDEERPNNPLPKEYLPGKKGNK
jgi:hypothetical protein